MVDEGCLDEEYFDEEYFDESTADVYEHLANGDLPTAAELLRQQYIYAIEKRGSVQPLVDAHGKHSSHPPHPIVVTVDNVASQTFMKKGVVSIGRHKTCDLFVPTNSRCHGMLRFDEASITILFVGGIGTIHLDGRKMLNFQKLPMPPGTTYSFVFDGQYIINKPVPPSITIKVQNFSDVQGPSQAPSDVQDQALSDDVQGPDQATSDVQDLVSSDVQDQLSSDVQDQVSSDVQDHAPSDVQHQALSDVQHQALSDDVQHQALSDDVQGPGQAPSDVQDQAPSDVQDQALSDVQGPDQVPNDVQGPDQVPNDVQGYKRKGSHGTGAHTVVFSMNKHGKKSKLVP